MFKLLVVNTNNVIIAKNNKGSRKTKERKMWQKVIPQLVLVSIR